ncbi:hypothetical protein GWI33_004234 [Rhynchophorus ferrugineus]|uniref:Single domain-containing protein n=1 Tax=Rhynchophorus ferrugineus TaxID=354439 RepID=A0A834MIW3_RHYFE|nr:hypothetical protein GWI33_004234 [Rhynchophorus ferrugineus]
MRFLLFSVVVYGIIYVAFSAIYIIPKGIGTPGDCYFVRIGPMRQGQIINRLNYTCGRAWCGKYGIMDISTCGIYESDRGVSKPDLSKPYPHCCPRPL